MSICAYPPCEQTTVAKGYCGAHHLQLKRGQSLRPLRVRTENQGHVCAFDGCALGAKTKGYCSGHYSQIKRGVALAPLKSPKSPYRSGHVSRGGYRIMKVDGRTIPEHRLVMERALGRFLWPDENVHHVNGDRLDNRPENLEIWSTSQPPGQRLDDKVSWAIEILERYGYAVTAPASSAVA